VTTTTFLQRALAAFAILGSGGAMPISAAAQELQLCELFSVDDAAQLVGQPIVNTVQATEGSRSVCARYADHAATLLEVNRFADADGARPYVLGGDPIDGLGDAANLVTADGRMVILRAMKGPYLVSIEVNLDEAPNQVTAHDLAPRVQAALDSLPALPCTMLSDASASQALGTPVTGEALQGMPLGFTSCDFTNSTGTSVNIISESGAFPAGASAADLAQRYIPKLPAAALSQIRQLQQAGLNFDLPEYQVAQVGGVGDAAVWVKSEILPGFFTDSLIVLHGTDAYSFGADDAPGVQAQVTALAHAALT
jgi:hypothetical protein